MREAIAGDFITASGATLVVIVALLVSGLRLVLPHLDSWRPQLLAKTLSRVSGVTIDASEVQGKWENFGPTLEVRDLRIDMQRKMAAI